VLAAKSPDEVRAETRQMVHEFGDKNRVIWSCGGGMPPNVTTENILAFKETIDEEVPIL
jgi:uroporphyrinogen decarboxylase